MRRAGDLLPSIAKGLGLEEQLRMARAMSSWDRLLQEHVPAAAGRSRLLALQPPALVVSADHPIVGQELRLRADELLAAFGQLPGGAHLRELRVAMRPPGTGNPTRGGGRPRVD